MKKTGIITVSLAILCLILLGHASKSFGQGLLLNEVETDPPSGASDACQYVEIRGTPGAVVPAGVQFISVDGGAGSFGDILLPVSLAGRVVGSNGTITIINDVDGLCAGRTLPAGTTQVITTGFSGLGDDAQSYLLISSPTTFSEGADIDTNNDRIIDPSAQITVIDGFAFTVNTDFQAFYAPNLFNAATQGDGTVDVPDAATRFPANSTPLSAAAWYFGELASSPDSTTVYSGTPRSSNFPIDGALTPGGPNAGPAAPGKAVVDFNGDGRTDYSVTRSSGGLQTWYNSINGSSETGLLQFGATGDIPVPEDFDGDGKDDVAVWRSGAPFTAAFYIFQSSNNTVRTEPFGQTGDVPIVTGDWDGDGKADPAVYRNAAFGSDSYFFYRGSLNNPSGNTTYLPWGTSGDKSMRGDFDGDGKQDLAVFRPSTALWYIRQSSNNQVRYESWGLPTDKFVPNDFDGDAKTDLAVYRDGTWIILQSTNSQVRYAQWGVTSDSPVPGDYNGDGSTDFAVWRSGTFYIMASTGGAVTYFQWGLTGDLPVASVFSN